MGTASARALGQEYAWCIWSVEGGLGGGPEDSEEEKCVGFDPKGTAEAKRDPWVTAGHWCWLVRVHPKGILTEGQWVSSCGELQPGSHSPLSPSGIARISPSDGPPAWEAKMERGCLLCHPSRSQSQGDTTGGRRLSQVCTHRLGVGL